MNLTDRLRELDPGLKAAARIVAQTAPEHDADDLYQSMVEAIMLKQAQCPEFLDQTNWYICRFATFTARHIARKDQVYIRYAKPEEDLIPFTNPDKEYDTDFSPMDFLPSGTMNPEAAVIHGEDLAEIARVIMSLPKDNRDVVVMMVLGESQAEISTKLEKSRSVISRRVTKAAELLADSPLKDCIHN
jgi:RNA polymerase sigma factor (sigma-70 family)